MVNLTFQKLQGACINPEKTTRYSTIVNTLFNILQRFLFHKSTVNSIFSGNAEEPCNFALLIVFLFKLTAIVLLQLQLLLMIK